MQKTYLNIQTFVCNLEKQFEKIIPGQLHSEIKFRDLEEWTSLQALVVVSSFDWDYGVIVSAEELRQAITIHDLFTVVQSKLGE